MYVLFLHLLICYIRSIAKTSWRFYDFSALELVCLRDEAANLCYIVCPTSLAVYALDSKCMHQALANNLLYKNLGKHLLNILCLFLLYKRSGVRVMICLHVILHRWSSRAWLHIDSILEFGTVSPGRGSSLLSRCHWCKLRRCFLYCVTALTQCF